MQTSQPTDRPTPLWAAFSAAPHRLFFFSAMVFSAGAMALWVWRVAPGPLPVLPYWTVEPRAAHGLMMIYGMFGAAFFGFLLTTFPRWLPAQPVRRGGYVTAWGLHALGFQALWLGLFLSPWLSAAGLAAMCGGHGVVLAQFRRVFLQCPPAPLQNRYHPRFAAFGVGLGALGLALAALETGLAALDQDPPWLDWPGWPAAPFALPLALGLYGFVLPVVVSVMHRMVPFFTNGATPGLNGRRSTWGLHAMVPLLLLKGWLYSQGLPAWYLLSDGPLALLLLREAWLWQFWRANPVALVRVLHLATGWMAASFLLSSAESLWLLAQGQTDAVRPPLGAAALHALLVGGLATLLLGMVTRVTLGHSGKGILAAGGFEAALFYGFQLVPLARVGAELGRTAWPQAAESWLMGGLGLAGWGWSLAFLLWLAFHGRLLLRPRLDGQPG